MATPSTDISRYDLTDETSAVSPAYFGALYDAISGGNSDIIGVCDNGVRSSIGMGLKWIDKDYNDIPALPADYFDKHPSWQFTEVIKDGNYFRKIPIAYTKRGTVPSGPNAGKWFTMLSPTPREGFEAHLAAFMYKGELKDSFLWGAYRACNNGGKLGSSPTASRWTGVSWQTMWDAAIAVGEGYHMGSFQEFHEILTRAIIEKKTFDLVSESARQDYQANVYRGIGEIAYVGTDSTANTGEYRAGVRTSNGGPFDILEAWDDSGNWGFVDTGETFEAFDGSPIVTLLSGQHFDHVYFAKTATFISDSMIYASNFCVGSAPGGSHFQSNPSWIAGAFCSVFMDPDSIDPSIFSSRLAYIG